MPFVDDNGNPVTDPSKAKGTASYPVTLPSELPARAKGAPKDLMGFLKQNAVPLGALGATGLAMDVAEPWLGIPATVAALARPLVMGAENVALNKNLPESMGGQPNASVPLGFATGAIPEAAIGLTGRAATGLANRALDRRIGGAADTMMGKLDPEAPSVRERVMAPGQGVPHTFPQGPELTNATFAAQAQINATIDAARTKYGAPIGEAYKQLKGDVPVNTTGFAQFAENLRGDMISPTSANANALLNRFRQLDPEAQKEGLGSGAAAILNANAGTVAPMVELPGGEMIASPAGKTAFNNELGKRAATFHAAPVNLDALRNLRQQVNTQLRTAQGGDRYMLSALQDKLDTELMDHLPKEMDQMRKTYAGFMRRWSYKDQQALSKLTDPQQVADFLFKDPVKAQDLMSEAQGPPSPLTGRSSETKITINGRTRTIRSGDAAPPATNPRVEALRQQFLQYVYGGIDQTGTKAAQYKEVRARLKPYMQDRKSAEAVMGPGAGETMRQLTAWPQFTDSYKEAWEKSPRFREHIYRGMRDLILERGMDPDAAMTQMVRELGLDQPAIQGQLAGLSAPLPKKAGGIPRGLAYHGAMLAGGLATGHALAVPWQASAVGSFFLANKLASFTTASKLGIVRPLLNISASRGGYATGRAIARALMNPIARKMQQNQVEMNDAAP